MSGKPVIFTLNQIQEPHSSYGSFDLACGVHIQGQRHHTVDVTEITGNEEDILASDNITVARKFSMLITNCVQKIGPYSDRAVVTAAVLAMTTTDRIQSLFRIRCVSVGKELPFEDACPNCNKEAMWTQNLEEIAIRPLADLDTRNFELELPSRKTVSWHIMCGADDERIAKLSDPLSKSTLSVLARIALLNGKPATLADIKKLGVADMDALRQEFRSREGGVDTTMELECPYCSHAYTKELDILSSGFFYPSAMLKAWRKKLSS